MKKTIQSQKDEIFEIISRYPKGLSRGEIKQLIPFPINYKTLQRRLSGLMEEGRVNRAGNRKSARYYPLKTTSDKNKGQFVPKNEGIFSQNSLKKLKFLDTPAHSRKLISYRREFLESYDPNLTFYIPNDLQESLSSRGRLFERTLVAETYSWGLIYERVLIDFSFNSSRLEGNTYSLHDTEKLLQEGTSADGKMTEEAVMILNHKEAISYLVDNAQEIDLNSFTILNLHNLLSQDLIINPQARGNIRQIEVSIEKSSYRPLVNQFELKELFELVLLKAGKIQNPFEQSFFILIHLSYLQALENTNNRTSRLACIIPFIKNIICPLNFTDIPSDGYIRALLAIYEKNEIEPMLDLFCWAYTRSCQQFQAMTETRNELDPYKIQTRSHRKMVMGEIIRSGLHGKALEKHIEEFSQTMDIQESDKFMAIILMELDTLHEGSIIGLGVSLAEFNSWLSYQKKDG